MKQRGGSGHGGGEMRNDAERAADGRDQTRAGASKQTGIDREQDAGARRDDDHERRQQEGESHLASWALPPMVQEVTARPPKFAVCA